jgi:hypothetical protein
VRAANAAERARRAAGEPKKPGKRPDTAPRNFTDPESRIVPNADKAFGQAYNGQGAVDAGGHQIIVDCFVSQDSRMRQGGGECQPRSRVQKSRQCSIKRVVPPPRGR